MGNTMKSVFFDRRNEFEDEIREILGNNILEHDFIRRIDRISLLGLVDYLADVPKTHRYTRYDHTLGVAHLILRNCRNLSITKLGTALSLISSLVHDIGHSPFSHSAELIQLFRTGYRHSHQEGAHKAKIASLIKHSYQTLPSVITDSFTNIKSLTDVVYDLSQGRHAFNDKWKLFNTPLCPDTFDGDSRACYSLRASPIIKVSFDLTPLDPDKLVDAISSHGKPFLVDVQSSNLLQEFNKQRFMLYKDIFYSARLRAAEAMFVRAFEIAYQGQKKIKYTHLTDDDLITMLHQSDLSKDLWERILEPRLFVSLSSSKEYVSKYQSIIDMHPGVLGVGQEFVQAKRKLENELAKVFGISPEFVILSSITLLNWNYEDLQFESTIDSKMTTITWKDSYGRQSEKERKLLDIYVPEEVL